MPPSQLDLFAAPSESPAAPRPILLEEPPPADFIARIRAELEATLATVRQAARFPWPDLTRTTLAEMRFNSIADWLPAEEAAALRTAFEVEMARLYEIEDRLQAAE
ncbi:MAG TPA: hypothetical protein VFA50_05190 [Stellaceae bacterium]|nr:hypothetical protein [Stellaceae bacterium]